MLMNINRCSNRSTVLLIFTILLTFTISLLIINKQISFNSLGSETIFYKKNLIDENSIILILFGLFLGLLLLLSIELLRFFNCNKVIIIIITLTIFFNLSAFRPCSSSWTMQIISMVSPSINPYFCSSFHIKNINDYPKEHILTAGQGYKNVPVHKKRLTTYPPGLPMFYYCLIRIVNVNQSFKMLLNKLALREKLLNPDSFYIGGENNSDRFAVAGLAVFLHILALAMIPLLTYLITNKMTSQKRAIMAAIFSAFIPSVHLYVIRPDIICTIIGLVSIYLCLKSIKTNSYIYIILCGVAGFIGTFLSFSLLPIIFLTVVLFICPVRKSYSTGLKQILIWGLSFIFCYIAVFLFYDYKPHNMFLLAMKNNQYFYQNAGRTFFKSIYFNIKQLGYFCGILISIYSISTIATCSYKAIKDWRRLFLNYKLNFKFAFLLSLGVMLFLLLISNGVRGEVERNCMPLMPLIVISGIMNAKLNKLSFYLIGVLTFFYIFLLSAFLEVNFGFWL